jgi:hypothetical protein
VQDAIAEKADVKDVCALIDLKSNIADVNVALAELQRGIDNRSASSQHPVSIHPFM